MVVSTCRIAGAAACIVMLVELVGPASIAQTLHEHPNIEIDTRSRPPIRRLNADSRRRDESRISTTVDDQILAELAPDDTIPANLFDLNGRTLVFTPDGHGGYSRSDDLFPVGPGSVHHCAAVHDPVSVMPAAGGWGRRGRPGPRTDPCGGRHRGSAGCGRWAAASDRLAGACSTWAREAMC